MRSRSLLLPAAALAATLILPPSAFAGGAIGTPLVYSKTHTARAGQIEAFRGRAASSGMVTRLNAYFAKSSTASRVELGLYRDRSRRPSARVARCVVKRPRASGWNTCAVKPTAVHAGTAYWATLLRPMRATGKLRFPVARAGRSKAVRSRRAGLKRLPRAFSRARMMMRRGRASVYANAPTTPALEIFVTAPLLPSDPLPIPVPPVPIPTPSPTPSPTSTPTPTPTSTPTPTPTSTPTPTPTSTPTPTPTSTPTPTPTSTPTPTPTATPSPTPNPTGKNCFADPSACGYPDQDNTGPSGTLQPAATASLPSGAAWDSGSQTLRITGHNVTVQNLDIPGPIAVDGDNATIRNSKIHVHSGCSSPCGGYGIRLGQSDNTVSGTTLQNLDIVTDEKNPSNDNPSDPSTIDVKVDHGVRNNGDKAVTADHLYIKGYSGGWKGPGTITNSYLFSQLVWSGDHVEAFLNGGEGNPTILQHDTILNPLGQTAAISFFNDFGGIGKVTVEDNLLAGGGYVMYGGAKNGSGNVTGPILIRNNRIARGNHDSHGYFPDGGDFGLWAEFSKSATKACANYWDDDLSATPAPSSTSC